MANIGDLVATASLDIAPFEGSMKQLKMSTKGLDSMLKTVENSVKGQGDKLSGLKSTYAQTGQSLTAYQALLDKQSKKYNDLKSSIGDMSNATAKQKEDLIGARNAMAETANKLTDLQNKYSALGREIAIQSSGWTKAGNSFQTFGDKLGSISSTTGKVASATKGMSLAIFGGMAVSAKAAMDFETAFAGVKKTVDEVPATNGRAAISYKDLEAGIRNMSKELPASAAEIAKVVEISGQLGIQTEDVLAFSKVMIDMGESTNMSAEAAATSLAKFANITKMSSSDYQRLGSAIVELGNNYATTEQDITEMSLRLAGAGTQAGLSQADIVGLATALSSVGIEAEMGGSAFSKLMVNMQVAASSGAERMADLSAKTGMSRRELELMSSNSTRDFKALADSIGMTTDEIDNIIKSSKNLENFASIAGMTASQFKQSFEKDAVGTIAKFVEGLGNAEKQGKTSIEVLNDMGISEVRLRDTLLRAGNASDIFTQAVKDSNKAWGDNKALTDEANKRYATTESKLKIVRNQLNDVAITLGGPLLDAFSSALDASKPLINDVADLAEGFSKLDKGTQQSIIYMALFVGAVSPVAGIVSKTTGLLGGLSSGFGKVLSAMGKIGAEKGAVTALESVATGAETATTSTVGLTGAVGLLANPVTWGVILGGAAVLAIGLIADNMRKAHQRTQEWGTEVSEVEANHLSKLKTKVDETTQSMTAFTGSADGVEDVKTAFKGLVDEIERLQNKDLAKDLKLAEKYGLTEEQIQRMRDNASQVTENAQKMSDEVVAIYKNASENHRELSAEEKEIVLNNQTELINKQLELMNFSKEERKNIQKAMNGDYESLNTEQLSKALDTTKKWLSEENKAYKQSKEELKELLKSGALTQQEYNEKLATLEAEHQAKMEAYGEKYISIRKKMAETSTKYLSPEAEKAYWNVIEQEMDKLGLSYDELQTKIKGFADSAEQTSGMTAKSMANMTDEMTSANLAWNTMVLDPKTGEIKTNAQEEIQKALQAEGGWESMQFVLKNANLETNAKIAIGEALVANDQWNSLTPDEKRLVTDGRPAIEAILSSKETLAQWNSMPEEVKRILGSNEQFLSSAEGAKTALSSWNFMTPTQKALTAQNLTGPDVTVAQQTVNSLTGNNVSLDATNNTLGNVLQANANVNSVRQNSPADINASDKTGSATTSANNSLASVKDKTVTVSARDNASSVLSSIGSLLSSLRDKTINVFTKHTSNEKGTNFHPGGLALVNDQKGPTYRELVTLPNGASFIPQGRNVMLPLPRGSKVLKASDTKKMFPHYADGIGFENTRIARLTERMRAIPEEKITATYQSDNSEVKQLLAQLLALTGQGTELMAQIVRGVNDIYDKDQSMVLDSGVLVAETGDKFAKHFSSIERRDKRLRGVSYD